MPTVLASAISAQAELVLQDAGSVRWSNAERLSWINAGQKEIVIAKPDASVATKAVLMAAGTKQTLGSGSTADAIMLLRVRRNMGTNGTTPGRVVTIISGEVLDAQLPDWHIDTASAEVEHYVYDPQAPLQYYTYPPNTGAGYVELTYSAVPAAIAALSDVITISDIYANALVDYLLYRAFSKDAEAQGSASRALAHYQAFQSAISLNSQALLAQNANVGTLPINPSVPAGAQ